jgi:O-antigen/teichoic acid export membrane protein
MTSGARVPVSNTASEPGRIGLARHASHLSAAALLTTVAGLVSFPVLTRLLSVDDYGTMNLVATLLAFGVAAAKLGVQHASLRFHGDARAQPDGAGLQEWAATVVIGMSTVGAAFAIGWAILVALSPQALWSDAQARGLLGLGAVLLWLRTVESALTSLLRAREETAAIAVFAVAKRWLTLAATLAALLLVSRSLWAFFGATVVVELLALAGLLAWVRRRTPIVPAAARLASYRAMLVYGVPMIGVELATVVLTLGDRYLIHRMLGAEALGHYTAAYNLCDYVRVVCLTGLVQALLPMAMRTHAERGPEATGALLSRASGTYALLALPTVAGLAAVGDVLLPLLASARYAEATAVIPWVAAGLALEAYVSIAAAGLLIAKRTRAMMGVLLGAALVNVALNLAWIPRWGIVGSAAATLASNAVAVLVAGHLSGPALRPTPAWGRLALHALAAAAMYAAVAPLQAGSAGATLVLRILAGVGVYAALVAIADPPARRLATETFSRLRHALA